MIDLALKKRDHIDAFIRKSEINQEDYKRVSERDHLTTEDWRILAETKEALKPFYECTKETEGRAPNAEYGCLWETLPAMEFILEHLERLKENYEHDNYLTAEHTADDVFITAS